jgi:hypothetical protein
MGFFNSKCKFCKKCPKYDNLAHVCNQSGGMYYDDETRPAGCYRKMEEQNDKNSRK